MGSHCWHALFCGSSRIDSNISNLVTNLLAIIPRTWSDLAELLLACGQQRCGM